MMEHENNSSLKPSPVEVPAESISLEDIEANVPKRSQTPENMNGTSPRDNGSPKSPKSPKSRFSARSSIEIVQPRHIKSSSLLKSFSVDLLGRLSLIKRTESVEEEPKQQPEEIETEMPNTNLRADTNIQHTYVELTTDRFDSERSRFLSCDYCKKLLWSSLLEGPTANIKEGNLFYRCKVCGYSVHPECKKYGRLNCVVPVEVYVWMHVEAGDKRFQKLDITTSHCFARGGFQHDNSLILTDEYLRGYVLGLSASKSTLRRISSPLNQFRIKEVCSGSIFTLFLTDTGQVYACGRNSEGQLGIGPTEKEVKIPVLIPELSQGVKDIACGGNHAIALMHNDTIFTWGVGRNGRLGNGSVETQYVPKKIEVGRFVPSSVRVAMISCGWSHSLVLLERKQATSSELQATGTLLFSFGRGEFGQCGHGEVKDELVPKMVEGLMGKKIVDLSGGYYHTACVTSTGEVYCFGLGEQGQCGYGGTESQLKPKLVPLDKQVTSVKCGGFHTIAITNNNELYFWGGGGSDAGNGKKKRVLQPVCINEIKDKRIVMIKSSVSATVCVVYDPEQIRSMIFKMVSDRIKKTMNKAGDRCMDRSQLLRLMHTVSLLKQCEKENQEMCAAISEERTTNKTLIAKMSALEISKLRRDRAKEQLAVQSKILNEERAQLKAKKEQLLNSSRNLDESRKSMVEKKEQLQEAKLILDQEKKNIEQVMQLLNRRKIKLLKELSSIFPIEYKGAVNGYTICGMHLPDLENPKKIEDRDPYPKYDKETISAALGHVCHFLVMISKCFQVNLPYKMLPMGSRPMILEAVTYYPAQLFPLFAVGVKMDHFRTGLLLLHKNIKLLLNAFSLQVVSFGATLPNLLRFVQHLSEAQVPFSVPLSVSEVKKDKDEDNNKKYASSPIRDWDNSDDDQSNSDDNKRFTV